MMEVVIYYLMIIGVNILVGGLIFSNIDDEEGRLFKWYDSCPPESAWILQPLALSVWPLFVLCYWRDGGIFGDMEP